MPSSENNTLVIRHPKLIFENPATMMMMICLGLGKTKPFPLQNHFPHSCHGGKHQDNSSHVPPMQPCYIRNTEKRALISTWGTPKLNTAMEKGCRVSEITEVSHFTTENSLGFFPNKELTSTSSGKVEPVFWKRPKGFVQ